MPSSDSSKIKGPADLGPEPSLFHKLAVSMMSDPGLSPMGLGVVAGSKGGQALVDTLLNESQDLTPLTAVRRYMQLKYPKLMSKITGGVRLVNALPANAYGTFVPSYKPYIRASTQYGRRAPQDVLETIGHELTHGAIQNVRTPGMIGSDYIQYEPYKGNASYLAYFDQPAEVNARQGGSTAVKTLMNFLSLHPDLNKVFGPMGE